MERVILNQSAASELILAPSATAAAAKPRGKWTLLAYSGAALPLSLAEIPIIVYLPAFYAQELHLNTGFVGIVFLVARLWDGLSDLLVGWLSDRSMFRFGRRKPWAVVGAPFLMLSTWLLCNPPKDAGLIYMCIWAVFFYTSFTAVKIPHISWGTELATDYLERSRVATYRETFTTLGYLLFAAAPLTFLSDNPSLHDVLILLSVLTVILVPLTVIPLGLTVPDPLPLQRTETHFFDELAQVMKDRVLIRFLLARFIFATEEGISQSLVIFSFTVALQQSTNTFFWVILILQATTFCTLPLILRMARHVQKHWLLAGGVMLQGLAWGAVLLLPRVPSFATIALIWATVGLANSALMSMPNSILADIIDHGEVEGGERLSGSYVAIDNLIYKLGMALGVGVSFGLLALVHFDPTATVHGAADILHIRVLGSGLPALLLIPAAMLFVTHPITKNMQRRLREQIESRHEIELHRSRARLDND
jgi:glycoside/pentoside/hexuronide:cation symporter, GPH family